MYIFFFMNPIGFCPGSLIFFTSYQWLLKDSIHLCKLDSDFEEGNIFPWIGITYFLWALDLIWGININKYRSHMIGSYNNINEDQFILVVVFLLFNRIRNGVRYSVDVLVSIVVYNGYKISPVLGPIFCLGSCW